MDEKALAEIAARDRAYRQQNPERIMSGNYSRPMWEAINSAKTVRYLRDALYMVGCRLQELEERAYGPKRSTAGCFKDYSEYIAALIAEVRRCHAEMKG